MPVWLDSKSPINELPLSEPDFVREARLGKPRPRTFSVDGSTALTVGIFVDEVGEPEELLVVGEIQSPYMLFIIFVTYVDLSVSAFSEKCITVAPRLKSLLNL